MTFLKRKTCFESVGYVEFVIRDASRAWKDFAENAMSSELKQNR
jgi:hypothetical protein